jgi:hypothetical protein
VISAQRRQEIVDALRRGTVPHRGLDALAVGMDRFGPTFDAELATVARGGWGFKAVRGEYGAGKTFVVRWLAERARRTGFATAEVQVSEGETPLDRLQTVYRRVVERLATSDEPSGALRSVVDGWFFTLEQDVLASGAVAAGDDDALLAATDALAEQRLAGVTRRAPAFAAALRGYRRALAADDRATADGLLAWLGGQHHVAASVKRSAGLKGDLDHDGALGFLAGLCLVLRDAGYAGLLVVLDEVETLQRVRSDARDRGLNALRQLIDEVDAGRFPGLYLVITGTPPFFDGPQGAPRLPPLAQRLHTDFGPDARFDNPRAVQIRLPGFTLDGLGEVGAKVRDLYSEGAADAAAAERIANLVDDQYLATLAEAVTGELGRRVGVAPRVFLKKLVGDVLDRVDLFPEFDPRRDYRLTLADSELTPVERNARAATSVDDIDLDV